MPPLGKYQQPRRAVLYTAKKLRRTKYRNPTQLADEEITVKHAVSIVWSL